MPLVGMAWRPLSGLGVVHSRIRSKRTAAARRDPEPRRTVSYFSFCFREGEGGGAHRITEYCRVPWCLCCVVSCLVFPAVPSAVSPVLCPSTFTGKGRLKTLGYPWCVCFFCSSKLIKRFPPSVMMQMYFVLTLLIDAVLLTVVSKLYYCCYGTICRML